MEPCPVCEAPHPTGALECATCGKIFTAAADAAIAASRLPEREPTARVAVNISVPPETTPGLEVTSYGELTAAAPVVPELVPGLEPTEQSVPAGAIALEAVPDLERTVQDPVGGPSSRVVFCRGCGATGQAEGVFCDRCGTRLSRPPPEGEPQEIEVMASAEEAPSICRACGCRVFAEGVCTDCGMKA